MNLPPLLIKTNRSNPSRRFPAYTCSILEPIEHRPSALPENILDWFQQGLNRFCRECGCAEQCWKRGRSLVGIETVETCHSLCDFFHIIQNQTDEQLPRRHFKRIRPPPVSTSRVAVRTALFYCPETNVQIVRVSVPETTTTTTTLDGSLSREVGVLWLSQIPIGETNHMEMLYWPSSEDIVPDLSRKPLCLTFDYFCSSHELLFEWRDHDRDHEIKVLRCLFQHMQQQYQQHHDLTMTSPYFIKTLQLPNLFLLDITDFATCLVSYPAISAKLRRLIVQESRYVPRRSNTELGYWETAIRSSLNNLDEFAYYLPPASSRHFRRRRRLYDRTAAEEEGGASSPRLLCGNKAMLRIQKLCRDRKELAERIRKLVSTEECNNNNTSIMPALWPLLLAKMFRHRPMSEVYELISSFHDRLIPGEAVPSWEDLLSLSIFIVS